MGPAPIPQKLLKEGVRDMVRISDARMSGASYGASVAPKSAAGGPLALVRTGDMILLDVPNRRLELLVPEDEIIRRKAAWVAPAPIYERGFCQMHLQHVTQADEGCDFDFLRGAQPAREPDIF